MKAKKELIDTILNKNLEKVYCRFAAKNTPGPEKEGVVFDRWQELKVIYYLGFEISENDSLCLIINEDVLKSWDIDREQLKKIAWKNTLRDKPQQIFRLSELIKSYGVEIDEENEGMEIYVITNPEKVFGAVTIMYPGVLEQIAQAFGMDFFVLPSSVHECLIVPDDGTIEGKKLQSVVRTVNRTEMLDKDILSDSVYRYDMADKELYRIEY